MDSRRTRALLALCLLLAFVLAGCGSQVTPPAPPDDPDAEPLRCPLDGTVLYRESEVTKRTLGVIIDNDPAAWPVSGLSRACLVYEVPVEGGLTRFLAFYHHQDAALTGPVRSVRTYFLPLVLENDAILAHVGGSEAALEGIAANGIEHFDELVGGTPFWQGSNRHRPYSTFTNTDQMRTAAVKAGYRGADKAQPFAAFSDDNPFAVDPQAGLSIKPAPTITFGGGAVSYRYDSTAGVYQRYSGDAGQRDGATGGGISPQTVVVLFLPGKAPAGNPEGSLRLTGSGTAFYFSGGVGTAGTWKRSTAAARTELLDAAGKPIVLRPGQVWVHVVYADAAVAPDLAAK
ncbi:MAG: DUF3048 domain-containing protein [Chloroflexota bacterium]